MPPSVGMRFSRFELVSRIGAGGMGDVWRAHDHDLHRDVAVKFLPERFASDPARLGRFAQEARAASSLNHPNIVTIHEIGETSGLPYIVMELVDGQTLREILLAQDGKPIPTRRLLEIGAQVGRRARQGPRRRHRAPRPQARERDGDGRRLREGARLRPRQAARGGHPVARPGARRGRRRAVVRLGPGHVARVALAADRGRRRDRHRRLHVSRAGARPGAWTSARTSSRSAPSSTSWPPAARPSAARARSRRSPRSSRTRPSRSRPSTPRCHPRCAG